MAINPSAHRPQQPAVDPEHERRLAWINKVRTMHRNKRMIGFAGIVLGACLLLWWKFSADAPAWSMAAGWVVLAFSWALFIYVIVDRWRWVKKNPYTPEGPRST
jgi:membrane protein YdbS with pleckstrin-like domain